jgi:pyrimidine-nucleoside phosphorylase
VGQSGNLVPADKLIYALRDVTATVESVGLIASSIMSKKIAGGARRLVLDVKTGRGAFMRDRGQALELARAMVAIGRKAGLKTVAVVSNMDQPLGLAVGNALEVAEAVACLKGEGPADLEELCLVLGAYMLVLAGVAPEVGMARERLKRVLRSGEALERLRRLVVAQGGDGRVVDRPWEVLPAAPARIEARASARGYVRGIDTPEVGRLVMRLGAGRVRKEDPVDPSVGVVLRAKTGDWLERGDVLGTVHGRSEAEAREAAGCLEAAYEMSEEPEPLPELIVGTVE